MLYIYKPCTSCTNMKSAECATDFLQGEKRLVASSNPADDAVFCSAFALLPCHAQDTPWSPDAQLHSCTVVDANMSMHMSACPHVYAHACMRLEHGGDRGQQNPSTQNQPISTETIRPEPRPAHRRCVEVRGCASELLFCCVCTQTAENNVGIADLT